MDRAEARAILESMKLIDFSFAPKSKATEALDLAIEALKEKHQLSGETPTNTPTNTPTDLISRQAIEYHTQLEAGGNGQYEEVEVAYRSDIDNLPPVTPKPIMTEEVREALMRLSMCAREECTICKYENNCGLDKQVEMATENTNIILNAFDTTPTEQNEEDILKFYYVESLDEYWIGQRCGTRYYGKWTGNCFTYGYSRYLPWGEHVVAPDTLWKEHTYPSEPKEIPFNEWLQGFLEKECQTERTGEWKIWNEPGNELVYCTKCKHAYDQIDLYIGGSEYPNFCPNCGAKMKGGTEND